MEVLTEVDPARIGGLLERQEFFWVDLVMPTDGDIGELGAALKLHPMALEDTREFGQRPKVDRYPGQLLIVFYTARPTGDPDAPGERLEVHIYLSGDCIATVRRERCDALDALHRSLAEEPAHDEETLVYRVLDGLTDAFYPVIDAVEAEIDALEAAVFTRPRREQLQRSYRLKQCVRELQRVSSSQREHFDTLHETILALDGLTKSSTPYLNDIGDHLVQIASEFHRQLDDLLSLTQTYYNANGDRLNAVASRATLVGTVFVTWTVVTGFFGQNFGWLVGHIESRTAFLIWGVGLLALLTVVLGTWFWVKRHDWF